MRVWRTSFREGQFAELETGIGVGFEAEEAMEEEGEDVGAVD